MEVVDFLRSVAGSSGVWSAVVLVLTTVITNIIKIPIKKHSAKIAGLAQKSGFNITERFINSVIVYIPFGVAFVMFCIVDGLLAIYSGIFSLTDILAKTPLIGASSIGLYSVIEAAIQKAAKKEEYKEYLKSAVAPQDEDAQDVITGAGLESADLDSFDMKSTDIESTDLHITIESTDLEYTDDL